VRRPHGRDRNGDQVFVSGEAVVQKDPGSLPFRKDVEGLRAIAVIMVILYHLGLSRVPGGFAGVDVFFVISGFLITGLLLKEVEKTGTISLVEFYARRAKRLLPAAALVLVATAVAAYFILPVTRWQETAGDVFAAAAYFINWRLAFRSVDYLAEDSVPSPVQHYWSLSVEEQYYLMWPALLVFALWLLRGRVKPRRVVMAALLLVALPSFAWSVWQTRVEPGPAYFSTATRMWQLAIGGGVAVLGSALRGMPRSLSVALGWAGLAAVVATAAFVTSESQWPGYLAALPTLGAAAMVASGYSDSRYAVGGVLGNRFFMHIGALSYSLYLWHWPVIQLAGTKYGELDAYACVGLVLASYALAWLTHRFVENPIRHSKRMHDNPRYALSAGLNFTMLGVLASAVLAITFFNSVQSGGENKRVALGAGVLKGKLRNNPAGEPVDRVDWMTPEPAMATQDLPQYHKDCHVRFADRKPQLCYYGDPAGRITIAMVGDSKIGQWLPAMDLLAKKNGWRIAFLVKSACGFNSAMTAIRGKPYPECYEWNRHALDLLLNEVKPDYVLTSQSKNQSGMPGSTRNDLVPAIVEWWTKLEDAGIDVVALADNPHPKINIYECVAENPDNLTKCAFPRRAGRGTPALKRAAKVMGNVDFIDLTDAVCPAKRCAPVIGNVLIYRQSHHITRTYIETLAPFLEKKLEEVGVE
jgi:peptidoglycan/LPS O-acetylase OafA/YrhL